MRPEIVILILIQHAYYIEYDIQHINQLYSYNMTFSHNAIKPNANTHRSTLFSMKPNANTEHYAVYHES